MRRTVLSAVALACTAVLASTVPAFADEATPAPTKAPTTAVPTPREEPTKAPATQAPADATPAPRDEKAHKRPSKPQVREVPKGAPNTGVTAEESSDSGTDAGLIGGGAAAVLVAGGAAVFVVRRRRATGA
ncbi:sortase-dependent protein [Streptomyces sp. ME19-01-6]|uniref:sortase-dependent protein n=1 Tax=Streptomyces sp. ME19-01-6 TaxID=3028686 RepID=UPI0029A595F8|nr:sortase-dependent protein [Streptomyces sp. ME19-01-6]MDX3225681.1 Tat pathway signal sequence domain protein [Streptomyces sp. ME19-01-6]